MKSDADIFNDFIGADLDGCAAEKVRPLFDLLLEILRHGENSDCHARGKALLGLEDDDL